MVPTDFVDRTPWYDFGVTQSSRLVGVRYTVPTHRVGWELAEETMPESVVHDEAVELLKALLAFWAKSATSASQAFVARNLAVRWDEHHPKVGVDPDICVVQPAPPDAADLTSVRTWLPGHAAPRLAIEVVSENNPRKDYAIAPDKYAASGVSELWIFDPLLAGPSTHGGPHRFQIWSRESDGDFTRIYAGAGPAFSPMMSAWLVAVDEGRRVRIADDEASTRFWTTAEENERAAKESERAQKESALARVAELEARLEGTTRGSTDSRR